MNAPPQPGSLVASLTPEARFLLLYFWEARSQVANEGHCTTPLYYPDGSTRHCVLSSLHQDECWQEDVPHAGPDGRLAPLLVSYKTLAEVRYWQDIPFDYEKES
jgi:hypothetical protein